MFLASLVTINQVIAFVCRRHHLASADAEDFASHARLKLIENGYAILAKFEGRSSLKTFLTTTILRLFSDYRNAAWGKWRPSAEARRGGSIAILLEQLLTRDGHTFEEACEIITTNYGMHESRETLEALAGRLPPRTRVRFEPAETLDEVPATTQADAATVDDERQRSAREISQVLEAVLSELPPQDRLILRLLFEDGRSVAEIASLLGLEQKPLYRRIDRLLRDLRQALEARGIGVEAVDAVVGGADIDLAADLESRETPGSGPSIAKGADACR